MSDIDTAFRLYGEAADRLSTEDERAPKCPQCHERPGIDDDGGCIKCGYDWSPDTEGNGQ